MGRTRCDHTPGVTPVNYWRLSLSYRSWVRASPLRTSPQYARHSMRLITPASEWTTSAGTRTSSPSSQTVVVVDEQTGQAAPCMGQGRLGSLLIVALTRATQLRIRVCHIVNA